MTDLQKYANEYVKFGWSIIPLYDYQKFNYKWEKNKTKKATVDDVNNWFANSKKPTGLAVVVGKISNLTVIDDDAYKTGKSLSLSSPLVSKTASGGRHLYFSYSAIGNSNNANLNGYNFEVQDENKLIVLPPSEAKNKMGEIGQYAWIDKSIKSIDLLPTIEKSQLPVKPKNHNEKQILDLIKAPLGTQHHNLRDLANKLLWKFKPEEWEEVVYPMIREQAQLFDPPHPQERVEKLIQDCSKWNLQKRYEMSLPKSTTAVAQERIVDKQLEKKAPKTGFNDLDVLIKGFVPGHLYTLTGQTNVGKTVLSANFAINVAKQNKRVLYFSLEPGATIVDYLASVKNKKPFDQVTNEELSQVGENIDIYLQDDVKTLKELVKTVEKLDRYDLIIIDHIGYYTSDGRTLNESQSDALKKLAKLSKNKQTAILVVAHLRKGTADIPGLDDISGSGSFKQDSTEVLVAIRDKQEISEKHFEYLDEGYILVLKTKSGRNGTCKIKFNQGSAFIGNDVFEQQIISNFL